MKFLLSVIIIFTPIIVFSQEYKYDLNKSNNDLRERLEMKRYMNIDTALKYKDFVKVFLIYGKQNSEIPKKITELKNLKVLTIMKTSIGDLPEWLFCFDSLTHLNIIDNPIKTIPAEIGNLKNLRELNIAGNLINDLPIEITNLQFLYTLSLKGNSFKKLPYFLKDLKELRSFSARFNKIEEFPVFICELPDLDNVDLGGNYIKIIPDRLSNLNKIRSFTIDQNRLNENEINKVKQILPNTYLDIWGQFMYEYNNLLDEK